MSSSVAQNIIYKHKKTVYWINDNFSASKTVVSFYTTRKAAMRQYNIRIAAGQKTNNLVISAPSGNVRT